MISLRKRTFSIESKADIAISKLNWQVEKVESLTNPFLNHSTVDTSRPWVGQVDQTMSKFKIIQTAPFLTPRIFECNFFQLYVDGRVIDEEQKSRVMLNFRLGLNSTLLFIGMYFLPFFVIAVNTENENWRELLFSIMVPTLFTLLLILQLNKTESKLINMFEA